MALDSDNGAPMKGQDMESVLQSAALEFPANSAGSFQRHDWFQMLRDHCFSDSQIVMAQAQAGRACATLPLVKDGEAVSALANYYSFSYGAIFHGHPPPDERLKLITDIARQLRAAGKHVSLYPLLNDDGTAELLRAGFAKAGWIALLTDQRSNHFLELTGRSFAQYWSGRPGRLRSAVRRKGKVRQYKFTVHNEFSDLLWSDYIQVYSASWKNAEPYPAMIRAIAQDASERGVLRLGFARTDDHTPVATQLWTIEGDTACIHKIAHDSRHDAGSPGTLLSHHMFAHAIDTDRVDRIDYGTGDNSYKRDWMENQRPVLRLDCFDARSASMWLPAIKTRISQLVGRPG